MPEELDAPPTHSGRTLLYQGLAQTDVDMDHHKLLNLDTSNLPISAAPPTFNPPANQWLHAWDNPTRVWTATQPNFSHIAGLLTRAQQDAITHLGTVTTGMWHAGVIEPPYLPTLDLIRDPVDELSMANQRIVNLADPVSPQDAVNKRFMDFLLQGLNVKESVRCATNSHHALHGTDPVDNVPIAPGNRVLVKSQASSHAYENGIYIVTSTGAWTRAADTPASEAGLERAYCTVREGTINSSTSWVQINNLTDPIGLDDIVNFVLFSTAVGAPGPPGEDGLGVPPGGNTGQVLAKKTPADNDTEWVNPSGGGGPPPAYNQLQTVQLSPSGTSNTTSPGRMMGLGLTGSIITPTASGKIAIHAAGYISNDSPAGAAATRIYVGVGTPPGNGVVPPAGSVAIGGTALRGPIGSNNMVPFALSGVIWNLTVGSQLWIDLALVSGPVGIAKVSQLTVTAYEIP